MPISEDEYDPCSNYEASSTMSKAELRKTHKPIMEKRRRARINHCLNEIKTLILDAMKKDPARHSKLEKADILEMAVKHLQNVQRQQLALAMATDPSVLRKFKAGFNECAEEVKRYIGNLDGLDVGVQQRISSHLSKCISGIEQIVHLNFPGFGGIPFLSNTSNLFTSPSLKENSSDGQGDQNNNPSIQIPQGLQLIPSRLPTGELALLLPNSNNLPYFSSSSNQGPSQESNSKPPRPSAFVTVVPSAVNNSILQRTSPTKPLLSPPQSPTSSSSNTRPEEDSPIVSHSTRSTPSPHGFRPVNPSQPQRLQISSMYSQQNSLEPHALVTSTSMTEREVPSPKRTVMQTEVKSIRFPIQKYPSPQKIVEPLSIITNQSERYKHAQIVEETAHYEENLQRGVKRKNEFGQPGLLAVAPPSNKVFKTYYESNITDVRVDKYPEVIRTSIAEMPSNFHSVGASTADQGFQLEIEDSKAVNMHFQQDFQGPSTSRSKEGNSEPTNDMWRPW